MSKTSRLVRDIVLLWLFVLVLGTGVCYHRPAHRSLGARTMPDSVYVAVQPSVPLAQPSPAVVPAAPITPNPHAVFRRALSPCIPAVHRRAVRHAVRSAHRHHRAVKLPTCPQ